MKELFVLLAEMVCEILRVLGREMRGGGWVGGSDVWGDWNSEEED